MKSIVGLVLITLTLSCKHKDFDRIEIRGSWYADLGDGGVYNTLVNYCELYITDTTIEIFEERFGQQPPYKYYIKGDSIFTSAVYDSIPMFKIDKFYNDSIFLRVNPQFLGKSNHKKAIWRRLANGEKGYYYNTWTLVNQDSLVYTIGNDWFRRRIKFHSYRLGRPEYYDSLLESGEFDWNMKEVREAEEREKEWLRTH
jgi:hypothetical protein